MADSGMMLSKKDTILMITCGDYDSDIRFYEENEKSDRIGRFKAAIRSVVNMSLQIACDEETEEQERKKYREIGMVAYSILTRRPMRFFLYADMYEKAMACILKEYEMMRELGK